MVPEKEGRLRVTGDLYSFWNEQKEVRLMDSNLTSAPMKHFEKIMEQLRAEKVKVDISQGLDLRLLKNGHCIALKGVRLAKQIHFAWDSMADREKILSGLTRFCSYFPPSKAMVYVLVGYDTTPDEDMERVKILRDMGVDPFVMAYDKTDSYQKRFARWVNHKAIFKTVAWEDYR